MTGASIEPTQHAESTRHAWLEFRVPPPVVALVVAGLMWSVASWGPAIALPVSRRALVGVLVCVGFAFDLLGLLAFRAVRTTLNPLRPETASTLVTHGIYRVSRNPMYVGLALLLTAWAVHLSSWLAFIGPVLFVAFITRFQIAPEERAIARLFPDEYAAYAGRVRRWV